MNGITVTIIDSFEGWTAAAPQWKKLLEESGSSSFFQTCEWLISWAECYLRSSRSLFILACYKQDKLIGIAPFYLEKTKYGPFLLKELRFLGTPESGSDYLDVIICDRHEEEVARAVYTFLMDTASHDWDQLVLTDIRADSLFLLHFMDRMEAAGKYVELSRHASCPITRLPNSEQEFYGMISKRRRRMIRQNFRTSHGDCKNISYLVYQGWDVVERLDDFFQLYEEKSNRSGKTTYKMLKQFTKKYKDPPPLQLDVLATEKKMVAALFHFSHQDSLYGYIINVDKTFNPKISLGNLLIGRSILNGIEKKYSIYDFLKGTEKYKFHWATDIRSTVRVRFWQKSPVALCSAINRLSRSAGKLFLR